MFGIMMCEMKSVTLTIDPLVLVSTCSSFCSHINKFQSRTRLELAKMPDLGLMILFLLFLLYLCGFVWSGPTSILQDLLMTQKSPNTVSKRKHAWCFWNISFPETFLLVSPLLASTSTNTEFLAALCVMPESPALVSQPWSHRAQEPKFPSCLDGKPKRADRPASSWYFHL